MDPFSLTTGILTLLGACTSASATISKLRRLKDAPGLIQALNNEISDLSLVPKDASDYLEGAKNTNSSGPAITETMFDLCSSTLDQAKAKVLNVEAMIHYQVSKPDSDTGLRIDKTAFLRNYTRILQLQSDLRDIRQKITGLLNHLGARTTSKIEVVLNEIRSSDLPELMRGQERIEATLDQMVDLQLSTFNSIQRRSGTPRLPYSDNSNHSSLEVSVSPLTGPAIETSCAHRFQSRSVHLTTFLGTLFLGYAESSGESQCQQGCPHHRDSEFRLFYVFPFWFLRYALSVHARLITGGELRCSLVVSQVIPDNHVIWDLVEVEEIEAIKKLLNAGKIAISAQSVGAGYTTPLRQAVLLGKVECAKFLLNYGASATSLPHSSRSPEFTAWEYILSGSWPPELSQQMGLLFPNPDFDELFEFTMVHKALLGLAKISVDDAILADPARINEKDKSGRTPLCWAVRRGDSIATQMIISRNGNCSEKDLWGYSPLAWAVRTSFECTKLLVQANADVYFRSGIDGKTLLHMAVQASYLNPRLESESLQIVELLLEKGIDMNAVNDVNETALMLTQSPELAEYLLKRGADSIICGVGGDSALSRATQRNHHDLVALFMREKHDHTWNLPNYGTFMHLAAGFADSKTLKLLAQGRLSRRDINFKDDAGLTPIQVAMQRKNVDAKWWESLISFLKSIDEDQQPSEDLDSSLGSEEATESSMHTSADRGGEISGSDEGFEEAVEFQA